MGRTRAGLGTVDLPGLHLFRKGKVRDTFDLGDRLLMVATDRLSAFDCVLPDLIPDRGKVLTTMSRYWFGETSGILPNHLRADDPSAIPEASFQALAGRMMFVAKAERIDIECVVRGRLAGSGWLEYEERGTLADEPLPGGLAFGAVLPEPRFTPATKNDSGHDENISRAQLAGMVGAELAQRLETVSQALFQFGSDCCQRANLVLVDTKFEFGTVDGELTLIDEVLTPDSSRLWSLGEARMEAQPHGFDKQPVRDYLIGTGWDRRPPAPALPEALVGETRARYLEVCRRITGIDL
jgi:phosphoribosylaminoimidazole-succinocarboxamide synthase